MSAGALRHSIGITKTKRGICATHNMVPLHASVVLMASRGDEYSTFYIKTGDITPDLW